MNLEIINHTVELVNNLLPQYQKNRAGLTEAINTAKGNCFDRMDLGGLY